MQTLDTAVAFLLANNLLFVHFFGLKESLNTGVSWGGKLRETGFLALHLVIGAILLWFAEHYFLNSGFPWLRLPLYALVLWGLSELYGLVFKNTDQAPSKQEVLLNSFLLGACYTVLQVSSGLLDVLLLALAALMGYFLSFLSLKAVDSRIFRESIPSFIQGLPLKLLTCGLIALVLNGLALSFSAGGR